MSDNKTLPLKLKDVNGNLQQINATEKNYVAYLAGLQNAIADSSDVGLLTLSASGNRSIGNVTDTYYPEPVGTHPYDQTSVVTTTTNLYQINGTALENDSDWRKPVGHYQSNVYEMSDGDLNTFVDDINGRIALSDYPGSLKLSATRPSADYDILIPSLLNDQRADSAGSPFTVNDYSVWRRTSMTAPTSVTLAGLKRSNGDSGTYQGLQSLTDRQVQTTIGQRAKTRRAIDGAVGSYELRTSSQGTPVGGTWKNAGSATNTIRLVNEQNYTRTRSSLYTRSRSSAYADNYTRTRSSSYAGEYTGNYTREFIGNYTREFTGNYTGDFTGDYSRTFVGDYSRNFAGNYVGNYTGNFSRNFSRTFFRDLIATRISSYAGEFTGNYTRDFTRTRESLYSRTRTSNYSRDFAGDYTRLFLGNYAGNYVGEYTRISTRDRQSTYTRTRIVSRNSNYTGDYTRFFSGQYAGDFTRDRISTYVGDLTTLNTTERGKYEK